MSVLIPPDSSNRDQTLPAKRTPCRKQQSFPMQHGYCDTLVAGQRVVGVDEDSGLIMKEGQAIQQEGAAGRNLLCFSQKKGVLVK